MSAEDLPTDFSRLMEDVTLQQHKLEELMTKSTVFEYNPYLIAITDAEGRVDRINKRFRRKTGYEEEAIRDLSIFEIKSLTQPLCGLSAEEQLREILRKPDFVGEFESKTLGGVNFMEEIHAAPVYEMGRLESILFIGHDITETKQRLERLKNMACHDQMTGLVRKDVFEKIASDLKDELDESGKKLGIFFMDLDRFKPINDHYGHHTGDERLIECARCLKNVFRRSDVVGRLGGDEFAALCPGIDSVEDMQIICEKIDKEINQRLFQLEGHEIRVGISIGACFYQGSVTSGIDLQELLNSADHCMYDVKHADSQSYQITSV